nr:hypothetical protein [Microbacterium galbinum]
MDPLDPPGLFACPLAPSVGEYESALRRISGDVHDGVDRDLRCDHGNPRVDEECDTDVPDREQHRGESRVAHELSSEKPSLARAEHHGAVEQEVHGGAQHACADHGRQQHPGSGIQQVQRGHVEDERPERDEDVAQERTQDRQRVPDRSEVR